MTVGKNGYCLNVKCDNVISDTTRNGERVTSVDAEIFKKYDEIISVTLPDSIITIGEGAFM